MTTQKGKINVNTENIFPIIKKFLYSDHEIFLRELISNAVDATQKVKKLASAGELKEELGDYAIEVKVNKEEILGMMVAVEEFVKIDHDAEALIFLERIKKIQAAAHSQYST